MTEQPALTVDRYGGTYSITREPWPWWRRPRAAWRLWWAFRDNDLAYEWEKRRERTNAAVARRLPLALRRAVIVDAAVRATTPPAIAPDAYAGPDGLDYVRLMDAAGLPR